MADLLISASDAADAINKALAKHARGDK